MSRIQDEVSKHKYITMEDVPSIIAKWAKQNLCPECGKQLRFGFGGGVSCDSCKYWDYR